MTIALYAEFTATAGNHALVSDLIAEFAQQVRAEPGNMVFDPHHRVDSPDTVFVYETYRDQAAFDEHLASSHGHDFNLRLGGLVVGGGSRLTMLSPITVGTGPAPKALDLP
ncbi:antibiotic biosynthesis monooxygenase [Glaciihabitans sp. INWT7]|uniref:putative quinol monooxygenase n=1 Tax=Glaciihabitans sp. INWT7 TaxID=2596912 RepID=UPI0016256D8E|nr:putative quinol monooxygenase [Glaciihabitans sp. INWT7]QNE47609.1 antibiotic biosynthesis monooxygenase [Glaciihabitans sp. INWT7]